MVVHGHRQIFFGIILPDDITIEKLLDLGWLQEPGFVKRGEPSSFEPLPPGPSRKPVPHTYHK
jgi:hypothetical protein